MRKECRCLCGFRELKKVDLAKAGRKNFSRRQQAYVGLLPLGNNNNYRQVCKTYLGQGCMEGWIYGIQEKNPGTGRSDK